MSLRFATLLRSRHLLAVVIALVLLALPQVAAAQVVVVVNGEPITTYDIEQRSRLVQITTRKAPSRQEAIDELIGDRLKLQNAKRFGLDASDSDVDTHFENIARNMRLTSDQLAKKLASDGLNPAALKAKLRADISWARIINGRFKSSLEVGDKDITLDLEKKDKENETGYEYILRPILFVVPNGSGEGVIDARRREAEALRHRFQNCEEGIPFARQLRDVAVREVVRRSSADLSPQLRKVLDGVAVGKLTTPEVTRAGVEVFALCEKNETRFETAGKRQAKEEIFSKRFQAQSERYLKELRNGAMIEYKQAR